MVNLKLIIYITPSQQRVFNTFEGFWAYRQGENPDNRAIFAQALQMIEACDRSMASNYHVTPAQAKHIGFIFGTINQANRLMADRGVRNLVFNQAHQIILIIRQTSDHFFQNLVIVFTSDHFTVLNSNWGGALRHSVLGEFPLERPYMDPAPQDPEPMDQQGAAALPRRR